MIVSVIMPVYRVPEPFLRACMKSLLEQTLHAMEFVFVADGADDPGLVQMEEAARRDSRVKLLVQKSHGGVSAARNLGLDAARGEWIGFVDADDQVHPEMYERLLYRAVASCSDLAGCGFLREMATGSSRLDCPSEGVWGMTKDFSAAKAIANAKTSCCSKLFRRDNLHGLRFDEDLALHEDIVFLTRALNRASRIAFTDQPLYCVCHRPDSAHRRPFDLNMLENKYLALSRLAGLAKDWSRGTKWMRRLWAWRLLAWSLAARRIYDELPEASHPQALEEIRRFYLSGLAPFHGVYPSWLRRMLEGRLESADRFFGEPGWYYTLLWNRIRIGMRPFEEKSVRYLAGAAFQRIIAGGRE